jgi:GTPase
MNDRYRCSFESKTICSIQEELLADTQATVKFRFRTHCEYVIEGSRLIFRSSHQTKGSGRVVRVLPQQCLR